MSKYTCELCLKTFGQKIDYTRHKNKKNSCVGIEQVQKVVENKQNSKKAIDSMSSLFSNCMDILRDSEHLIGDKALRNLSYLLVLRLIEPKIGSEIDLDGYDYILGEYESKKSALLELSRFSKIASSEEENIPTELELVWTYILAQHPKTKDIFLPGKGFDIKKQTTFKKLVDKLSKFDFESITVDVQGHAYEDLLKDIMTGKVLGQFFTLPLVKDLMVKLVNPSVNEDGTVETLFDPAMGTAGFLMSSICHIQKQAELKGIDLDWKFITEQGFGGREAEPSTFQLAKSNLLISSGHLFSTIEQGDSIRDPITNKYDIVLANPPFGIKGLDYQEITSHLRNEYMPIESKSAVPLFLQVCISILKVGGRCAMVMPDGQELFGKSKGLIALREYLMKTCDLKEIYFFPPGVFTNTSIKTCVVYFHKKKEGKDIVKIGGNKTRTYKFSATHQTKKVKFYDYNPYEKVKNLLVEVDVNRLAENGYSLNYAEYLEEEEEKEENEGVEWKTLGEIFDFKTSNLAVGKCSQSGEYMFVSSSDINTHNQYTLEGDNIFVLKVFDGAKNKSYKTKFKYYSGKCSYSNLLYHMKPKITIIPKFFYYILANDIDNISVKYQKGSCNKSLNLDLFQKYKIPIPSLSIQQATIEKLDFLYERDIEGTKRKIEELKLKRDMIVENATIGVELKTLGEVCEINPESMKKNEWDTINYIDISSVGSGSIIEIKEILDNFPSRAKRKIKAGDTIYSTVRPNLCTYAYIERDIERGIVSTGFAVIRPKGNLIGKFISYIISQPYISDFLSKKATGAQYPAVSTDIIKSITIPIPPLAIQQATVEQCERLERLISSLEQEIKNSKELAKVVLEKSVFGSKPISEENSQVQIVFEDEQDNIIIVEDSDEDD